MPTEVTSTPLRQYQYLEQPSMAALLRRSSAVDSYNVALCVCVCLFAGSTRSASRGHAYIPRRASFHIALCTPCLYLPRIIFTCEGNTVNQPIPTKKTIPGRVTTTEGPPFGDMKKNPAGPGPAPCAVSGSGSSCSSSSFQCPVPCVAATLPPLPWLVAGVDF